MAIIRAERWITWTVAVLGPLIVTAALVRLSNQVSRDYVFIYLGLVAVVGVVGGLWPAVLCAAISFLCVDWFFVQPPYTFTIADETTSSTCSPFLSRRSAWACSPHDGATHCSRPRR